MTKKRQQQVSAISASLTAAGAIAVALFVGVFDTETNRPEPIEVDGEVIEFTWTDDNTDEDLWIYTDRQNYSGGLSQETVYVAVANRSGTTQDINLTAYFADTKREIRDVDVLVQTTENEELPIFEEQCVEVKVKKTVSATSTDEEPVTEKKCEQVQVGVDKKGEVTKLEWTRLPTVSAEREEVKIKDPFEKTDRKSKDVEDFFSTKYTDPFEIQNDEVLYYRFIVDKLPGDESNFYFEAYGSKGAYGHLDPWFIPTWQYRVEVTVESSEVDSTLSDFPVYVDLSDLPADFHSNVLSTGCDIRVVESDEETETAFELVEYDAATDTGELHFLADSLSSTVDTVFYVYYGNAGASCYATDDTYGAEAVWTNYGAVYHMNESSGDLLDSTANDNDGTMSGTLPNPVAGKIGTGQDFNGTSDEISVTDDASIKIASGDFTVQYWMNTTDTGTMYPFHYAAGDAISNDGLIVYKPSGATGKFRTILRRSSAQDLTTGTIQINDGSWHSLVSRRNGTAVAQFVDDTADGTVTSSKDVSGSFPLYIGSGNGEDYTDGILDEMRIINNDYLTDDRIAAEYTNQNTPTTFYTTGSQELVASTWFDTDWTYRVLITIDDVLVPSTQTSFPVYLDLAELPTEFHTNVKTDGCDIRMVEADGTTQTAFELVDYDSTGDEGEVHFMADTLNGSGSGDSFFYVYYGNSGASCLATDSTFGAENVWGDYSFVSHDGGAVDSTGSVTTSNTSASFDETTNVALGANARRWDGGGSDQIDTDLNTRTAIGTADFTISAWMRTPTENSRRTAMSMSNSNGSYHDIVEMRANRSNAPTTENYEIAMTGREGTSGEERTQTATGLQDDTYQLIHITRETTTVLIYANGADDSNNIFNDATIDVGHDFAVGGFANFAVQTWNGELDEVRVRNDQLSANWISAEHTNQSSPSTFTVAGEEEENVTTPAGDRRVIITLNK